MMNICEHADHMRTTAKRRRGFRFDAEAYDAKLKKASDARESQWLADMDAMPAHFGLCYFIGNVEAGIVKIGHSRDVPGRRNRLSGQSPFPLRILATITGGSEREGYYHAKFNDHALGGEWFTLAPEIAAEITRLNATRPADLMGRGN